MIWIVKEERRRKYKMKLENKEIRVFIYPRYFFFDDGKYFWREEFSIKGLLSLVYRVMKGELHYV